MKAIFLAIAALILGNALGLAQTNVPVPAHQGQYFPHTPYNPHPLPAFDQTRLLLPAPIFDEKPEWIGMYWKAWELAFKNFHEPTPQSGYVSQFIDAAFSQNIFLWDTCFMTMFCNFGYPLVPGIGSLDNFYVKQYPDGEICREIDRATGSDYIQWQNRENRPLFSRFGWNVPGGDGAIIYTDRPAPQPPPLLTLDAMNHPILAWAELDSYQVTGDARRLKQVYPPLVRYYRALQKYLRQGNDLYMTDWASMDNSPRNPYLNHGGAGIDISSEMALFARHLSVMATLLGKKSEARGFTREREQLATAINNWMWDPERQFYFDLSLDGKRAPIKTVAAFWTLLAGVPSAAQVKALVAELNNPNSFARLHRVPTLAADSPGFNPAGGYWCGAVWAPTETMVIRGLQNYGYSNLARQIALNHLDTMGQVFQKTGTVWENYAPDAVAPGQPAMSNFVGWSGIGPIMYLLEFAIGLKPDAAKNELLWTLGSSRRVGCERFRFNGHIVSLVAEPAAKPGSFTLTVTSDGPFRLAIRHDGKSTTWKIRKGKQTLAI